MFSECEEPDFRSDIRQGDVFEWLTRRNGDPWRQFGIIVTADCDLAYDKHAGILSYVPILPLQDYIRLFYLPRRLRREADQLETNVLDEARRLQMRVAPRGSAEYSEEAVRMLLEQPASAAVNAITTDPDVAERLVRTIEALQACRAALTDLDHESQIDAYVAARGAKGATPDKARTSLMNDVQATIKSLPGDGLFLRALSPIHNEGYVAYLRVIRETSHDAIALRIRRGARSMATARRISRLTSPYVYHLTQRLSGVFAAVGLPAEYEENRASLAAAQYPPS